MVRCSSTALLFAIAITLLPADAHAGRSGASFHPAIHPMVLHPGTRGRTPHGFHKFSHHHHRRFSEDFGWGLPFDAGAAGYYGPDYEPADQVGDVDPALPAPASWRRGGFYRTGCRSEEVSVPSAHGPTIVTVTRCSVPIPELQPLK